jgi:hypothetical protein
MSEVLRNLPKNSPERIEVANQIRAARDLDRVDFRTKRGLSYYRVNFQGLDYFFDYASRLESNVILDIGTGKGVALREMQSRYGNRFKFIGTRLSYALDDEIDPLIQVIPTSAEILYGIPDESVAGVLAGYSIAYSAKPEYALRRIDQVLIPGGVIKAVFYDVKDEFASHTNIKSSAEFENELRSHGYDTSVSTKKKDGELLVAIKPGFDLSKSASDLLLDDQSNNSMYQRDYFRNFLKDAPSHQ